MSTNRRYYITFAIIAVGLGACGVSEIVFSGWHTAFLFYVCATLSRLCAGYFMNRVGDAEAVNYWDDHYHRYVVTALNTGVGAVLLCKLWWELGMVWGKPWGLMAVWWFLTIAVLLYFIAIRFTRPNTFGERVRSATLTVVLLITLAYLALGMQYFLLSYVGAVLAWFIALARLAYLADRFDWARG